MQIRKMKRKDVRCIVEVVGDGSVIKHYDETVINMKLQHYDKDSMVTIYEPTEEQKAIQREAFYREQQYGKTTQYIDANDAYIKLKYFNYLIQDCGFVDIKNAS